MLPDEVLLAIFGFCVVPAAKDQNTKKGIEAWQPLVHVCRRWRSIVFGSPRHLNLRLVSTDKTSVRDMLDVWPLLPLVIHGYLSEDADLSNIVAALEHRDRVHEIQLQPVYSPAMEEVLAVMQEPFPELTDLQLLSDGEEVDEMAPVIPDSFLGGSAPRLRFLWLDEIPFPGLPNLLLSATHLVNLRLSNITHFGYILPDAMVIALSALTSLDSLLLDFQSSRSHLGLPIRRPLPSSRFVLPVLTHFSFNGDCEYLDDFVARIGAPRLHHLSISFFNGIVFDAPQFIQFIGRTPTPKPLENAHVDFEEREARINFYSGSSRTSSDRSLEVGTSCWELYEQVSFLELVCASCSSFLSTLENLYMHEGLIFSFLHRQNNLDNMLWLDLLRSFTTVKNLYLSKRVARRIVPALQELVEERTTEVLPVLQNIFLEKLEPSEPVFEDIQQFVAMRQAAGHPVAVSSWERDSTFF